MKIKSLIHGYFLIAASLTALVVSDVARAETSESKDELMSYQFQVLNSHQMMGLMAGGHAGVDCSVSHAEGKETIRSAHPIPGETYFVTKINGRHSFGQNAETKATLSFNIESLDSEGSYVVLCHNKKSPKISLSEIESALKEKLEMRKI